MKLSRAPDNCIYLELGIIWSRTTFLVGAEARSLWIILVNHEPQDETRRARRVLEASGARTPIKSLVAFHPKLIAFLESL